MELAIPFASIRFPNKDIQSWRMDFWRNRPRESYHQYSWAANDRNEQCFPCKWGTVSGIRDVHPGKGIEVLPTLIANQASFINTQDKSLAFARGRVNYDFALGGKYSLNSNITVEATYNPDFSQVEADAAQIDVNTTIALFYPERRPFFQEGRDIFRTLFNSFYTRTINDPQFAAKLTGRSGKYRFGVLSAVDENSYYIIPLEESTVWPPPNLGKSYVNVFRGMRSFGESSQLGFMINDRRYEAGGYNTIMALDQSIRLSRTYNISGQYIATFTEEPDDSSIYYNPAKFDQGKYTVGFDGESFTGYGFISRISRNARHWNMFVDFNQVGRSYRTETGYDPWVNYRNLSIWNGYNIYMDDGIFERIIPQVYAETRWNYEGDRKWTHVNASISNRFRFAQTSFTISYNNGSELWNGIRFNDLWNVNLYLSSRLTNQVGMEASFTSGAAVARFLPAKGKETSIYASLNLKPVDRLIIEPNISYYGISDYKTGEKFYDGFITRTRFRFQATRALSARLVLQFDDFNKRWDIDPLVTFRLSPFSVFYFGSTADYVDYRNSAYDNLPAFDVQNPNSSPPVSRDWKLDSRQFFMKLQYLFQT